MQNLVSQTRSRESNPDSLVGSQVHSAALPLRDTGYATGSALRTSLSKSPREDLHPVPLFTRQEHHL